MTPDDYAAFQPDPPTAEHECDCTSDREAALAWAARAFGPVDIGEADVLADAVLLVADRYHTWLTKETR